MQGREQAAKRDVENAIALAWNIAARTVEAQNGKLKKIEHYMPCEPAKAQTPAAMLAAFMALQGQGAPMNIRKMH